MTRPGARARAQRSAKRPPQPTARRRGSQPIAAGAPVREHSRKPDAGAAGAHRRGGARTRLIDPGSAARAARDPHAAQKGRSTMADEEKKGTGNQAETTKITP